MDPSETGASTTVPRRPAADRANGIVYEQGDIILHVSSYGVQSLLVAFSFRCNLKCDFCLVEDMLDRTPGVELDDFRRFLDGTDVWRGAKRIVFSGGEVTLHKGLMDFARLARSLPGVEHVRIQTNGIRLGRGGYLGELVDAGIDEYFVSLHGADPATCDAITQVPGSLPAIEAGLAKVAEHPGATLITNTAVCSRNVTGLDRIVELAHRYRPASMELWNLWPRVDTRDERRLMVPMPEMLPHVLRAADRADALGLMLTLKMMPRCLLGRHAGKVDNTQPGTLIHRSFFESAPPHTCLVRDVCASAADGSCTGFPLPYVHRFGWHEDLIRPDLHGTDRAGQAGPEPEAVTGTPGREAALEALGLIRGAPLGGAEIAAVEHLTDGTGLTLFVRGQSVRVWLRRAVEGRPAWRTVRGLDLLYEGRPELEGDTLSALRAVAERLERAPRRPAARG